ncbi:unnamed protein product [Dovyalis caffra]|uniref:Uncharacterized protein n=1 Tax=Dovyalis caffra TaxID=77055 RepID=A0AAV1R0F6_9ROSI|nr:unnamed protein product [Dovyalis caffra]
MLEVISLVQALPQVARVPSMLGTQSEATLDTWAPHFIIPSTTVTCLPPSPTIINGSVTCLSTILTIINGPVTSSTSNSTTHVDSTFWTTTPVVSNESEPSSNESLSPSVHDSSKRTLSNSSTTSLSSNHDIDQPRNTHLMLTRAKNNIHKPIQKLCLNNTLSDTKNITHV